MDLKYVDDVDLIRSASIDYESNVNHLFDIIIGALFC
jgi:hypothetical protein